MCGGYSEYFFIYKFIWYSISRWRVTWTMLIMFLGRCYPYYTMTSGGNECKATKSLIHDMLYCSVPVICSRNSTSHWPGFDKIDLFKQAGCGMSEVLVLKWLMVLSWCCVYLAVYSVLPHAEKGPARPMLFYSTSYWHQF